MELRPEALTFETRQCLLPGTLVRFKLVMEGRPLALQAPVGACLVMDRQRGGYVYNIRLSLDPLAEADRHLIALYIAKGRGHPELEPD